jgi:Zn-dependent protease
VAPAITFFASGFMLGWASAPYDPHWQQSHPRRAGWMALAGPGANFILLILAIVGIRVGIAMGAFAVPESITFSHMVTAKSAGLAEGVAQFLSIVFSLNLMLGTFNLLPLPPLDGSTAVGLLLSEKAALRFAQLSHSPMLSLVGILIAWQIFGALSGAIFRLGTVLLYPGVAYSF